METRSPTSYFYTYFASSVQMQSMTVTLPIITTAENGPGTADVETTYLDVYGRPIWHKDGDGFLSYTAYDQATGAITKTIEDVDVTKLTDFMNLPAGWVTPIGGGLHLVTAMQVDALGRDTQTTSPAGNVSYAVYNDPNHSYRVYAGWNSGTGLPTGPTQLYREDRANSYVETLTMSATPHLTGGLPDGTEAISGLQTLSRDYTNAAGQRMTSDDYFSLAGLAYSTAVMGVADTNFYQTQQAYDDRGKPNRVLSPTGTITRILTDGLGRVVSRTVGTNDTGATDTDPTGGGASGNNMVQVAGYVYDNGGVGDGYLTQETDYPGGSATPRVTQLFNDWRGRLVASKSGVQGTEDTTTHRPIVFTTYDNLDEAVLTQQFDGDGVSITTVNGVPQAPSASLLRAQVGASYDEQGRVFLKQVYGVNPTTGAVSSTALATNTYYDHRGNPIAQASPGGLWNKETFDGAGRPTMDSTTDGAGGTTWAAAGSVANDIVLQQMQTVYDADSNSIETITKQRFHDETATGALSGPLVSPKARVYYAGAYFDAGDRQTTTVDVGTNGGTPWMRPSTPPAPSDTALVTSVTFNAAGWVQDVTDPMGLVTRTLYDNLRRITKTIENYTDGIPTANSNKTTEFTYDGSNHVLTVQADLPAGAYQKTQFVYGVTTASGSTVNSNDLLSAVQHPDPTTGNPSSAQQDSQTVNALGEVLTETDRNGNVHQYTRDILGRQISDAVTTLGAGVDGSVRRIETAYDTQRNAYLFTSFDAVTGGNIVSQVMRQFNGLRQITAEFQEHGGAVNTSTSPVVRYAYTEMAGGVNNSRLTSITYPNGRVINYTYGAGVDDRISRLTSLSDSSGTLESYLYLGLATVVQRSHPLSGIDQTFIKMATETNGDAGDPYNGLDRFGRTGDLRWVKSSDSSFSDHFQYGFDRDSNDLFKLNLNNAVFSELNQYDGLNQLTNFQRGTLNSTHNGIVGSPTRAQSWNLDALGNFSGVTSDGTTQTRTHNAQNEITGISGTGTPTYDANGNMTADGSGKTFVYDAWNHLVTVNSGGSTIASYRNDALGRRITETHGSTTTDLYYSAAWQVVEVRVGGVVQAQNVWSPVYVDALVMRDQSSLGNGVLDQRLFVQQDANWNVTALVSSSGVVVERYVYDAYGAVTILAGDWSARGTSSYGWLYLHQGGRYDTVSGLYLFRNRDYSPTLERWMENDPEGFTAGDNNTYRTEGNNPTNAMDPSGLESWGDMIAFSKNFFPIRSVIRTLDKKYDWHAKLVMSQCNGREAKIQTDFAGAADKMWKALKRLENDDEFEIMKKINGGWNLDKKRTSTDGASIELNILFTAKGNRDFYLKKLRAATDMLQNEKARIHIDFDPKASFKNNLDNRHDFCIVGNL